MIQKKIVNKLYDIVGKDHVSVSKETCACYSYDATNLIYMPDAVVFPGHTNEIQCIMQLANEFNLYVTPRGAGTGMTGGALPVHGGIIMVMTRFNQIRQIDKDNLTADVQPGVITGDFHQAVEKEGLFFPPDPSSSAYSTLGGNVAECAGGPRAVKYGVTRDYVLGLEAVLPSGELIHTGVRTVKGVTGYDLTRLIIGSEGTLAIITGMTLKLIPLPASIRTMSAVFDSIHCAAQTVSKIIQQGIPPRTIEFMDQFAIQCADDYLNANLPVSAGAMLIIEVDGDETVTNTEINRISMICQNEGASISIAKTKQEADILWQARKAISPALFKYAPDKLNEDIVVPRSKIPDLVDKICELRELTQLTMVSFGHAGDGNIHFTIMLDKNNPSEVKQAELALESLFDYTIQSGGTLSGEHGIGITKASYLSKELSPVEIKLMKSIKYAFDPKGILNPGKIFCSS